ncbi:MAG: AAA family ATPase [Deltaproteobacteria bacterium]|nr:AAA family ATPase [Deltaproteobacteria bacterium]
MPFTRATKLTAKLRLALAAPSGAGKTYTALQLATHLGGPIAVIDTERGSASKYADLFAFDVIELDSFHPQRYIDAIHEAEAGGYGVLIIDSLSHAWAGKDGALELVDAAAKRLATRYRSGREDAFAAWQEVTPLHNALVDAMVQSRVHLIATLRTKTEYVVETKDGRTKPRKIGLAPIQREGLEYEYDVAADLDHEHTLIIHKSRCPALAGKVFPHPGKEVAELLLAWLQGPSTPPAPTMTALPSSSPAAPTASVPPLSTLSAPASPSSPTVFLTTTQLQSLVIRQKECGVSDEVFREYLTTTYQIQSRKLIPAAQYQTVLTWLTHQRDRRARGDHTERSGPSPAATASPSAT